MITTKQKPVRSPLSWPGGKRWLAPYIAQIIRHNGLIGCRMVEPFCGGAAVGLHLLQTGHVRKLWLNDANRLCGNFWVTASHPVIGETLAAAVEQLTPSLLLYRLAKAATYEDYPRPTPTFTPAPDLENAVWFLLLNRCSFSGIVLDARPYGGWEQKSQYTVGCRWNGAELARRIRTLSQLGIQARTVDAIRCLREIAESENWHETPFLYLDPPYVRQSDKLYQTGYTEADHRALATQLKKMQTVPWLLSYDNDPLVYSLYPHDWIKTISTVYSVSASRAERSEILIKSPCLDWPE